MDDAELELRILERYVARHAEAETADPHGDKCASEVDMREVIGTLTGATGAALDYEARRWLQHLAPGRAGQQPGPLRLCGNSRRRDDEHRYHARAFFQAEKNAWNRIRDLRREVGSPTNAASELPMSSIERPRLRIFISHASEDADIAGRVADLLRVALNLQASEIRCTSVDGYRLAGGADTDDELRRGVKEADVFVGILSAGSVRSTYVLIELGGRWVLDKHLLPLLAPGTPPSVLAGPIAGKNALRGDSDAQLHQMVAEIAYELGIPQPRPDSYHRQLRDVAAWKSPSDSNGPLESWQVSVRPETLGAVAETPKQRLSPDDRDLVAGLSADARDLLTAAADDRQGAIMHLRTLGGTSVRSNGKEFAEAGNPRAEARWSAAVKDLELRGLVEDRLGKGELFFMTDDGYRLADLLK